MAKDVLKFPPHSGDVQVHLSDKGAMAHFFEGGITHWTREPDEQGEGIWIRIHYANGGSINVLTTTPLVWAEPNRQ